MLKILVAPFSALSVLLAISIAQAGALTALELLAKGAVKGAEHKLPGALERGAAETTERALPRAAESSMAEAAEHQSGDAHRTHIPHPHVPHHASGGDCDNQSANNC